MGRKVAKHGKGQQQNSACQSLRRNRCSFSSFLGLVTIAILDRRKILDKIGGSSIPRVQKIMENW